MILLELLSCVRNLIILSINNYFVVKFVVLSWVALLANVLLKSQLTRCWVILKTLEPVKYNSYIDDLTQKVQEKDIKKLLQEFKILHNRLQFTVEKKYFITAHSRFSNFKIN